MDYPLIDSFASARPTHARIIIYWSCYSVKRAVTKKLISKDINSGINSINRERPPF